MSEICSYLTDIAANLTDKSFAKDIDAVIDRAMAAGVKNLIVTGTDLESSEQAVELSSRHPGHLFSTAGVHPHYAKDCNSNTLSHIKALLQHPSVKAIGETGLDFNRNLSPAQQQEQVFAQQLEMACEMNIPIFMHEREAHNRFYEIVRHYRDELSHGVLHCFTGTKKELFACLDLDLHIGITGWICDERRGQHLLPLLKEIPLDRLMLETDAPYLLPRNLSPKPKSRRNEPAYLTHICQQVAQQIDISPELLAQKTTATAKTFFGI
ncbi:TatD family hydrolase [Motiliproteus sp. MSK22-1]|uniref:TatD family hydrolase n=1 Tax=Motiliproteus sp. MSK22-1 TaxID=1897630 RepID=UPI000976C459|nr:TatD family hydrolase [Motiliproteus sp. MSK22-1]OMH38734.1 hydrolase TatD [Motiliproteus sp. MSK22-1]